MFHGSREGNVGGTSFTLKTAKLFTTTSLQVQCSYETFVSAQFLKDQ